MGDFICISLGAVPGTIVIAKVTGGYGGIRDGGYRSGFGMSNGGGSDDGSSRGTP